MTRNPGIILKFVQKKIMQMHFRAYQAYHTSLEKIRSVRRDEAFIFMSLPLYEGSRPSLYFANIHHHQYGGRV